MDFSDTPEEAAFRAETRAWLADNAKAYRDPPARAHDDATLVKLGLEWQAKKFAAGYGAITLSQDFGGRGGTTMESVIFADEESRYFTPGGAFIGIGLGMAVPTILAHGTAEQAERLIKPTLRGQIPWCQLFSEPAAGSDLAGLRTRAVREGDDWIINGQKVWTSWGHHAQWALLIARTDPSVPKHKGLTYFLCDMRTPGIDVRPIRQISGRSEFNEVFLTDVHLPDSLRVGAVGAGWTVAMTTLMNERGGASGAVDRGDISVQTLLALAREAAAHGEGTANAATREKIARLYAIEQGLKYFRFRGLTALSRGGSLGPLSALAKLTFSLKLEASASLAMDLQGYAGIDANAKIGTNGAAIHEAMFWAAAMRIAGGSDEVIRNQIAERVLGLPGEPRADRDVPFDQLPAGR